MLRPSGFRPSLRIIVPSAMALVLAACATTPAPTPVAPPAPPAVANPIYKVGTPYEVAGVWYYPREQPDYDETGIASWYGTEFHGRLTANGEIFDRNAISAAHPTLPMPINARVTNLENGRTIVVRINDRGPFVNGRIIDLSEHAADLLGYRQQGTARVRVTFLGAANLDGNQTLMVGEGTPPEIANAVSAAPAGIVSSNALPPVAGVSVAETRPVTSLPTAVSETVTASALPAVDGQVSVVPVPAVTAIYVQAGAYGTFENANRVAARLSGAGAQISQVEREGRTLYRVRMGPVQDVGTADAVLFQVQSLGHNDVGIVVE